MRSVPPGEQRPWATLAVDDLHLQGGPVETAIFDADSHLDGDARTGSASSPTNRSAASSIRWASTVPAPGRGRATAAACPGSGSRTAHQEIGRRGAPRPQGLDGSRRPRHRGALPRARCPGDSTAQPSSRPSPSVTSRGEGPRRPLRRDRGLEPGHGRFLRADPRLKAVGYLPLTDPTLALPTLERGARGGCGRRLGALGRPRRLLTHPRRPRTGLGLPRRGGGALRAPRRGGKLLPRAFHNNGLPRPKDWLGGGENLRSKDFPVLTIRPSASSPAWRSTGSSSVTRICVAAPSSSAPPGCRDSCATWTTRLPLVLEVRAGTAGAGAPAVGVPPPPGALHALPVRGHGLAARAVRPRPLHVLDRLPPSRGREAAVRDVRGRGGGLRRVEPRAVLLAQRGRAPRPRPTRGTT